MNEVGELPTVLRYIDVFMAKMAPRLRAPLATQVARQLYQESGGAPVSAAIIKEFGIYPPGEFVQLKSGELAVVVRRGRCAHAAGRQRDRPAWHAQREHCAARHRLAEFAITGPAPDKNIARLPPERLFGIPSDSGPAQAFFLIGHRRCRAPRLPRRPGSSGGSA